MPVVLEPIMQGALNYMFFVQQISLRVEEDNITNFSDLIIESITRKFIDTTSLIKLEKLYCFNFIFFS